MDKELRFLHGEIRTPPLSEAARREIGYLLRELQSGVLLSMPQSRPMPSIGDGAHELRVRDGAHNWRVMYAITTQAILILEVFAKTTQESPDDVIENCERRLKNYLAEQKTQRGARG